MKKKRAKTKNPNTKQALRRTKNKVVSKKQKAEKEKAADETVTTPEPLERAAEHCPYCESKDFVKRGVRKNKHQEVQLYVCRNHECGRTFTSRTIKGKQFPWPMVLDAISYHNLGYTYDQTVQILGSKHNIRPHPETIAGWYETYKPLCRFERLRPYALKILNNWRARAQKVRFDMVETVTLAHRQLYRFRYHRPKLILALEEYKNRNFGRLMEYLDTVITDTPHQFFSEGARMSEVKSKFSKANMIVKGKTNFANRFAEFVLQGVPKNKDRHEVLQRFMIANDSVTVATEVPVYIRKEDVAHMEQVLKFKVTGAEVDSSGADIADADLMAGTNHKGNNLQKRTATSGSGADNTPFATAGRILLKGYKRPQPFPDILTGHIDAVQVRNGVVHILDYKPNAEKERPIEQLTWYALALSRLTGLRLFEFKCAWFDEHEYFEFYPLHVVKKLNRVRRKKVRYKDGKVASVPNDDELHIIK